MKLLSIQFVNVYFPASKVPLTEAVPIIVHEPMIYIVRRLHVAIAVFKQYYYALVDNHEHRGLVADRETGTFSI